MRERVSLSQDSLEVVLYKGAVETEYSVSNIKERYEKERELHPSDVVEAKFQWNQVDSWDIRFFVLGGQSLAVKSSREEIPNSDGNILP